MSVRKTLCGIAVAAAGSAGLLAALPATASAAPAPATLPGTPCTATAKACVDLSAHKAWLVKDGHAFGPYAIAPGRSSYPTPTGTFKVLSKDIDHKSGEFNGASMPYSVFFYPGDAFHEGSVHEASHGCIHLGMADAKHFYGYLQVGDQVQVRP